MSLKNFSSDGGEVSEKHSDVTKLPIEDKTEDYLLKHERKRLSQGLKQRHIQMLTLVGVIGTGLFLSSGGTLAKTGPCGILLCYLFIGIIISMNQLCIAETSCMLPATGSTIRQAEHFMDEAIGFSYGWISVYSAFLPTELAAAAVVVSYWTPLSPAIWISIMAIVEVATNSYSVRFYGEVEFCFGLLKISLVFGLIICGLVIDLGGVPGQDRIGFRYWDNPGPFAEYIVTGNVGKFCGFWSAINSVVYAYAGLQGVATLAGETEYPRRSIFRAAKRVMFRICFLYCASVFILGLLVPYNDSDIATSTGTASSSPFVIAIKRAGIPALPSIINAVVLTSAFSSGNLGLVTASRTLFALAVKKQAPKILLRTNKRGVPYVALGVSACFLPLAYMSCSDSADTVFSWFQNITSSNTLLNWILISVNHIAMSKAMKVQGYSRDDLPHKAKFTEAYSYISLFFSVIFLLTAGYENFMHGDFDFSSFFTDYFIIPLFFILYFFWKILKKTKFLKPSEVDLASLFKDVRENPEPPYKKLKGWEVLTALWA
ncbi:hypothetical protein PACTADRAFT_74652 [Pachysolen tannophilus NRRL Y-2460]|uniref:Amino acid permease/ SLC12A domain-containing protein n=1 Tax=Pachysolen tannophilus NRRL Y-2460 TaxID=669874 RepID=A0A1E4TZA2_PACTA|nr:hypothetical protein PACTADRAFT_74652 [Pachysolen tannophilus NRRL Y-2460]